MLYIRRIIDLLLISVIPSLIAQFIMSTAGSYHMRIATSILCTVLFYFFNIVLLRRFVYDIQDRNGRYFKVQLIAQTVNMVLAYGLLHLRYANALSGMFYYTRVFEFLASNESTLRSALPTRYSMAIAFIANYILIFAMKPVFENRKRMHEAQADVSNMDFSDDELVKTHRGLYEMAHKATISAGRRRRKRLKQRTASKFWGYFLNVWSYGFYQAVIDKVEHGENPWPMIKRYSMRHFGGVYYFIDKNRRNR